MNYKLSAGKKDKDDSSLHVFDTVTRDLSCNSYILIEEEYMTKLNPILSIYSLKSTMQLVLEITSYLLYI